MWALQVPKTAEIRHCYRVHLVLICWNINFWERLRVMKGSALPLIAVLLLSMFGMHGLLPYSASYSIPIIC